MKTKILFLILLSTLLSIDNCLSRSADWHEFEKSPYGQEMPIGQDFQIFNNELSTEPILWNENLRSSRPDVDNNEGTGGEIVVPVGNGFFVFLILMVGYFLYKRRQLTKFPKEIDRD